MDLLITNGILVTPSSSVKGTLHIENDVIAGVYREETPPVSGCPTIDAEGHYVLPGLIDLHGDAIEKAIQPRKGVTFPVSMALRHLQGPLLAAGITTMFHGISFTGDEGPRSNEAGYANAREIAELNRSPDALLRHKLHLRFETANDRNLEPVYAVLEQGWADLFSLMDHSPQHGKYRTIEQFRYYVEKNNAFTKAELETFIREKWEKRETVNPQLVQNVIDRVRERRIPFASHDDYDPGKLEAIREQGASISEFPLNAETARYARQRGMHVIVGGPNLVRGFSHENHLSARDAVFGGMANIICSDYYPYSVLAAVFQLHSHGMDLHRAISYATSQPAIAAGIDDRLGSLETGKQADLIVVRHSAGEWPTVVKAMVGGKWSMFLGA